MARNPRLRKSPRRRRPKNLLVANRYYFIYFFIYFNCTILCFLFSSYHFLCFCSSIFKKSDGEPTTEDGVHGEVVEEEVEPDTAPAPEKTSRKKKVTSGPLLSPPPLSPSSLPFPFPFSAPPSLLLSNNLIG